MSYASLNVGLLYCKVNEFLKGFQRIYETDVRNSDLRLGRTELLVNDLLGHALQPALSRVLCHLERVQAHTVDRHTNVEEVFISVLDRTMSRCEL